MKLGLEVFLEKYVTKYKGEKIGLFTNLTGVNQKLQSTVDLFYNHEDIRLTTLFSPEHGIAGDVAEGALVDSTTDHYTKLPIYSLYNREKAPNERMFDNVDVIFCDIQDIGTRYYTFIYSIANIMKLSQKQQKKVVVLDRPNPINGTDVEGGLVEEGYYSFVGEYPIPNRHGLTIGEIARLFNDAYGIHCELEVIGMEGWKRSYYFDETAFIWVPPTPNTTGMDMCTLYPGTCLIEGTNISEGRGTTKPFEVIGAPFINGRTLAMELNAMSLGGVLFRPTTFRPTASKYVDEVCEGIQIHLLNREVVQSVKIGVNILSTLWKMYGDQMSFIRSADFNNRYFIDLLAGNNRLRKQVEQGNTHSFQKDLLQGGVEFNSIRHEFMMYE